MPIDQLAMGIDFGTVGVRIALINQNLELIYSSSINYPNSIKESKDWKNCCQILLEGIPVFLKKNIKSCSIDGTSGTLIACNLNGDTLGEAIPYYKRSINQEKIVRSLIPNFKTKDLTSLGRALELIERYGEKIILRHQADWITCWLTDNWFFGEESNNLKLGWDIVKKKWPKNFYSQNWFNCLPKIISSGKILGKINIKISKELGIPEDILVVAGTTDSNAAVIAANPSTGEGVTILGSTIVIKKFIDNPIYRKNLTNHFIIGKWLCGGSSNTGGRVLRKFFSDQEIVELSKQINPDIETNIKLLPLAEKGERFPIDDPSLEPILTPRPVSDSLYLQALLEGLAEIESQGWEKLISLGIPKPHRIITIGSGSKNIQWKKIRERIIGIPIKKCSNPPAIGVALIALKAISN